MATFRRALPWLVAAAILLFLFRDVELSEALRAADHADLSLFVPLSLGCVTTWWVIESTAFAQLFSRFNTPLSWAEARSIRAVTYLLTPINWNLGTGAIILHLRRSKGVAVLEATSSILFYGLIDALALGSFALAGVSVLPPSPTLEGIARGAAGLLLVALGLLALFLREGPSWGWLQRIKQVAIFRTHRMARARDVAVLFALRFAYFGGFVLFFWIGARAFHVDVSLGLAAASVPLILIAGSIPVTPAGLGTQQAAILFLFAGHGSEAQILAFGLAVPVAQSLSRVLLGLFYVRDLGKLRAAREAP